jgi:hypothetical protein
MTTLQLKHPLDFATGIISRPPPPAPVKKTGPRAWLWVVVGLLAGAAVGWLLGEMLPQRLVPLPGPKWLKLASLLILPLAWLTVLGAHELGHIVGGWLGGGKFLLWQVGPVMVRRTPTGLRAGWNRQGNWSGGLAACLPQEPAQCTPAYTALLTVAGPLASFLLTLAALWLAGSLATWDHPLSLLRALAEHYMMLTAMFSFMIFVIAALPYTVGGFKSDGLRVLDLLRGGRPAEQEAALVMLTAASLAGTRPADYDAGLVARAVALQDGSLFDRYAHVTVYYHAADRGDWGAAQAHLDYALAGGDQLAPFIRDILRCEYAWLPATHGRDAAGARAWLETAGRSDFDPAARSRAEAAVLLAEGKKVLAGKAAAEGLRQLRSSSLSPVENPFARAALEAIAQAAAS